jgi:peptidoglycan/LPS O-acetylase OafA/YrhL
MEPQRPVFAPLNDLRGIAALAVVTFHASVIMGEQLAPRGYLAVDLFFVLSGFVIAHAYDRRLAAGLGAMRFFWLRLKRFYPLYLAGLALGALVAMIDLLRPPATLAWSEYAAAIGAGLLFLPLPLRDLYPLNVPAWSLLCELVANLAYGFLWRSLAGLAAVALLSWVLLLGRDIAHPYLVTGLLRAGFSFPAGVLIYRFRDRLPKSSIPGWIVIAALGVTLFTPAPELLAITIIFPVGIALLARCEDRRGFELLGRLSFPLYAVHWPLLQLGLGLSPRVPLPLIVQGFLSIALCVVAAWAAERWIDPTTRR